MTTNYLFYCVCGKEVPLRDARPTDYNVTCAQHRHLAHIYNLDLYLRTYGSYDYIATEEELQNNVKKEA
jgi:hypothetical protein